MPLQLGILRSIQPWHIVLSSLSELEQHVIFNPYSKNLLPVCLGDFLAVERKDNIVCCPRFVLKLSCENKSAAAPIHARSNDSPCKQADFPAKKALASKIKSYM